MLLTLQLNVAESYQIAYSSSSSFHTRTIYLPAQRYFVYNNNNNNTGQSNLGIGVQCHSCVSPPPPPPSPPLHIPTKSFLFSFLIFILHINWGSVMGSSVVCHRRIADSYPDILYSQTFAKKQNNFEQSSYTVLYCILNMLLSLLYTVYSLFPYNVFEVEIGVLVWYLNTVYCLLNMLLLLLYTVYSLVPYNVFVVEIGV